MAPGDGGSGAPCGAVPRSADGPADGRASAAAVLGPASGTTRCAGWPERRRFRSGYRMIDERTRVGPSTEAAGPARLPRRLLGPLGLSAVLMSVQAWSAAPA